MNCRLPFFTEKEWFSLPIALRQRWWSETNCSEKLPSADLLMAISAVTARNHMDGALWLPIKSQERKFCFGDRLRTKRDTWQGTVCGFYTAPLTPIGYCVLSEREKKSVQIYSESALELVLEGK